MNSKTLIWTVTVGAMSLVGLARADGVRFDKLAMQGLVPPASALAPEMPAELAQKAAGLSRQPGLRPPRYASEPGAADGVTDFLDYRTPRFTLYSGARTTLRLGTEVSQAFGGVRYPLGQRWASSLEAGIESAALSPTRSYTLLGQVHRLLPGGWDVTLGLQYTLRDPQSYSLVIPESGIPLHAGLYGYPGLAGSYGGSGYEFRLSLRYGERNTIGLTYGQGSEFDFARGALGLHPGDGRQFGLTGQHWLTPDWAVSYGLMAQDQIGPIRGQGLRFGLRYNF